MGDDAERPRQVSVAELLAQHGGAAQSAPRSRRRRAAIAETPPAPEPPTDKAEPTREVDPAPGEADRRPAVAGPHAVSVAVLLVELVAAVAVGAALWLGFRWLWGQWPVMALLLAVLVSVGSVVAVRLVHRVDDVLSMLLALVVGIVVTMSPAALVLVGA